MYGEHLNYLPYHILSTHNTKTIREGNCWRYEKSYGKTLDLEEAEAIAKKLNDQHEIDLAYAAFIEYFHLTFS